MLKQFEEQLVPNQVWSWDITKLRGPVKWTYFYLYVILDIFSRYVTGWMLARRESAELARRLISESCLKQNIEADQLTIHADRSSSMRSKSVALLLADLGITKTHSRPYVSNDNPRLVKILEGPAGQQFAPSQRLLESAIAVGYVFQLSGRSRDGLEDHADLHLRIRG